MRLARAGEQTAFGVNARSKLTPRRRSRSTLGVWQSSVLPIARAWSWSHMRTRMLGRTLATYSTANPFSFRKEKLFATFSIGSSS